MVDAVKTTPHSSSPNSSRSEPLKPFDRFFILFASVTSSVLAYKSIRPGFFQKGLSFTILAGGSGYAFGFHCKCCKKTIKSLFNGFNGSPLGGSGSGGAFRLWSWPSKRVRGDTSSTHTAHQDGQQKRFEVRDGAEEIFSS